MIRKSGAPVLHRLSTGIPKLDQILGGGIPQFSINIIAGQPGSGKTILAQQLAFAQARPDSKVLYVSTISEPALKLIRYQSQFSFFKEQELDRSVFYRNVADNFQAKGYQKGINTILRLIDEIDPRFVFIDSFKAIVELASSDYETRRFAYDLALRLTSHEITSFLIGEYTAADIPRRPEFAVVDGILLLALAEKQDQPRYLEVRKLRGSKYLRGRHPLEINGAGITCYPHPEPSPDERHTKLLKKVSSGIEGLDVMSAGGFYEGSMTVVAGSAGTGKTSLAVKFLGKDGLLVSFEEKPGRIERYAENMQLDSPHVLYISPIQFISERANELIKAQILKMRPKRVTIDGMLDVTFDSDVLYDLLDFLLQQGITTLLIYEIRDIFGTISFVPTGVSRLIDNVILLRYVELNGRIERFLTILKMRGSPHDNEIRAFEIRRGDGLFIKQRVTGVSGLMTGIARPAVHAVEELAKGFQF
ncbi:AAA family ATPase [Candidatus Uhrbacteria bacterium]|nr:AAA family ATPase [Candidatus Uhrbacteria bacterium]